MAKILFLGSTGFIGSAIFEKIKQDNNIFHINYTQKHKDLKFKQISFKNISKSFNQIKKFKPTIILDFSWRGIPHFNFKNFILNVKEKHFFYQKISKIKSIEQIILAGSCMEYKNRYKTCHENDYTICDNYLNLSKITVMNMIKKIFIETKVNLIWLRIFYAYGKGQRTGSLIPYIINNLKSNKKVNIKNFDTKNDFIHIDDIADLIKILIRKKIKSGIYNVGSGNVVSVRYVYKIICDIFNKKTNMPLIKKNIAFKADITKIKKATNWKPKIKLNKHTLINIINA